MQVSEFDFELPADLIAQVPAMRGRSRLLVMNRASGRLQDSQISDLPRLLQRGDLLVVNNTRVFAARLRGRRVPSGGAVECFLLKKEADDGTWSALVHPGQKLKAGARVRFEGAAGAIDGEIVGRHYFGRRTIRLRAEGGLDLDELIDALGHVPLPPYIKRNDTDADRERYQTVYAAARGSVAAPTAGLHFTHELLAELEARGIERAEITLHVGYGTFKPVRTETVESHSVDPEHYEISDVAAQRIEDARRNGRRIIAVGTTTTRALEDSALRGGGRIRPGFADAATFIYPGFSFQVIGGLLTNFHLPRSSLLMLVSAFVGREPILAAYRHAIEQRYRFYSYGDAMLML